MNKALATLGILGGGALVGGGHARDVLGGDPAGGDEGNDRERPQLDHGLGLRRQTFLSQDVASGEFRAPARLDALAGGEACGGRASLRGEEGSMTEIIERPPRRDLNATSERILLYLADSWLSSPLGAVRCWNVEELTEAGLIATDDDGDHRPTDLGIRYSRAWLDLDGFQEQTRAQVLRLVARGPVPLSEVEETSMGFAYRWLLRSGELARLFSAGEGPLYGLPETGGDPTQSPGWSRLAAGLGLPYAPALNGLLSTGHAYRANWEKDRLVRLTARGVRRALWERPGGQLLQKILPAWRATAPEGVLDDFLERRLGPVTITLEAWIVADARRSSEAAIPDVRLVEALLDAAAGDVEDLVALARSALSDYWAMDALRGRGVKAHPDGALLVIDALVTARARFGGGDMDTMRAIKGAAPSRWRPPVYRRSSPPTGRSAHA